MSDTPRTDTLAQGMIDRPMLYDGMVVWDHAKKLERELAVHHQFKQEVLLEISGLRAQNANLKEELEKAVASVNVALQGAKKCVEAQLSAERDRDLARGVQEQMQQEIDDGERRCERIAAETIELCERAVDKLSDDPHDDGVLEGINISAAAIRAISPAVIVASKDKQP